MLVRTIGGQRVKRIGHRNHPRQQRNLISLEAVRIAAAIESLVMKLNARKHFRQLSYRAQNVGALGGVSLHDFKFFRGKRARLFENAVFDADLAHVVELRGNLQRFHESRSAASFPCRSSASSA